MPPGTTLLHLISGDPLGDAIRLATTRAQAVDGGYALRRGEGLAITAKGRRLLAVWPAAVALIEAGKQPDLSPL